MANTATRRHSTRIESRRHDANSPPHNIVSSISSVSTTPFSYYHHRISPSTQERASSSTTRESHHTKRTKTTRYSTRSQDPVPEVSPTSDQMSRLPSTHATSNDKRNSTVRSWILANYEMVPNVQAIIPRSAVYEHYRYGCALRNIEPVNSAMFGKVIRVTFPDIKTRRLGNRGHSKYQYGNIRRIEIPGIDRNNFTELPPIESYDHQQHSEGVDGTATNFDNNSDPSRSPTRYLHWSANNSRPSIYDTPGFPSNRLPPPIRFTPSLTSSTSHLSLAPRLGDLLSDLPGSSKASEPNYTPPSPTRLSASSPSSSSTTSIPTSSISDSYTKHLNDEFAIHYNHHCRVLFDTICAQQFDQIQGLYERFYYEMPSHYRSLLGTRKIVDAVWRWDCLLYDSIIVNFLPEIDTPTTKQMASGLLRFTRNLPKFLPYVLREYSFMLRQKKSDVALLFAAKMRRHLTLNHLALDATDVLRQSDVVENMKMDWEKLDIDAIQDQVFWICDCQGDAIYEIVEQDIPHLLDNHSSLKEWTKWVEGLIDKYLPGRPKTQGSEHLDEYLKSGKQFMLKWKVYSGLLMQELYRMNAFSTDSCKILQQFLDDFILYYVEERIAKMNTDANQPERTSRTNPPLSTNNDF